MAARTAPERPLERIKGALWVLIGALCFSLMNTVAKLIALADGPEIPVLQITFARYAIAAAIVGVFVAAKGSRPRMSAPERYFARTVAGFGGIALMFVAVQHIPLATATAIGFTSPIFAMAFAALLLGDRVRPPRWLLGLLGLTGALLVASPDQSTAALGALIALAAAIFMGAEVVGVKWLSETGDSDIAILLYSNLLGVLIVGAISAPWLIWPSPEQAGLLIAVGAFAIAGQVCILRGMRLAEASFLAPFFYASLIYAACIGYLVFGETVSGQMLAGGALILASAGLLAATRT